MATAAGAYQVPRSMEIHRGQCLDILRAKAADPPLPRRQPGCTPGCTHCGTPLPHICTPACAALLQGLPAVPLIGAGTAKDAQLKHPRETKGRTDSPRHPRGNHAGSRRRATGLGDCEMPVRPGSGPAKAAQRGGDMGIPTCAGAWGQVQSGQGSRRGSPFSTQCLDEGRATTCGALHARQAAGETDVGGGPASAPTSLSLSLSA